MVYLLGKTLSMHKRVYYALRGAFPGIGITTAQRICDASHVHPLATVRDLSDAQWAAVRERVQPVVEGHRQRRMQRARDEKARPRPTSPF